MVASMGALELLIVEFYFEVQESFCLLLLFRRLILKGLFSLSVLFKQGFCKMVFKILIIKKRGIYFHLNVQFPE